jgi:hypothetical protein
VITEGELLRVVIAMLEADQEDLANDAALDQLLDAPSSSEILRLMLRRATAIYGMLAERVPEESRRVLDAYRSASLVLDDRLNLVYEPEARPSTGATPATDAVEVTED